MSHAPPNEVDASFIITHQGEKATMLQRATFGILLTFSFAFVVAPSWGQEETGEESSQVAAGTSQPEKAAVSGSSKPASNSGSSSSASKPSPPKYASYLKDAKAIHGLIPLHHKGSKLYAELSSSHYSSEYIVLISIARGIGQGPLYGGMSWGFGDDWVWKFRKVDDHLHIIRRNVRFKANKDTPEAAAVANAYTDSVLFSLPIITKGPKGGDLVDLTPVFMSDLPQISMVLRGFVFSASKSSWAGVKGFNDNVELQVAATYASSGTMDIDSIADSRGATINVHYSISKVPTSGYTPRLADDRIGYFLTVVKDFSEKNDDESFVRYINRWKLQKADAKAEMSVPKEPIIFWLEKTIPFAYRKPIRDGILEWNKAFEKAGFYNAVEVRQQPENADWDPEDINYNTFRWITSSAGVAMGPSRVNPYTGQILDADIIFDADFLDVWKREFETLSPDSIAAMKGYFRDDASVKWPLGIYSADQRCARSLGMAHQFAFGSAVLDVRAADPKKSAEMQEKLIRQGLKEVTMHEVGHTLGLRHNFKASTYLELKELNDPAKTKDGMVASVMDYTPANIVPKKWQQGDYYTTTVGPYDIWAIEYGYKVFSGGTNGELAELKKIAARSGEEALQYATDEDTRRSSPDPRSARFDLGKDPLEFAKQRAELVKETMPGIVDRMTKEGDDYTKVRRAFNVLLAQHGSAMEYVSRYVGGLYTSRSHKGDKDAKPPIESIDPKYQREALALLEEQVFDDEPYLFSPEIYAYLAASNWQHWGSGVTLQEDFPLHDVVAMWQQTILSQLLSPVTLERIHDTELKVAPDQDAFTAAELIERLTKAIFAEVDHVKDGNYTNRKPAISSLRRNLQRKYLSQVSRIAMGTTGAPADCQTIAYAELHDLRERIERLLNSNVKLDSYSRAHLRETASRIEKVLNAELFLSSP